MLRVGIVGVSGYGGGELARLLSQHPLVELTHVVSNTYKDQPLSAAFPGMARRTSLICKSLDLDAVIADCDVVFLAQENGFAMKHVGKLLAAGKKVIDLSADFRLKDLSLYPAYYKFEHASPELFAQTVYGLPELNRDAIKGAALIANPGCYATAAALSLAPLVADSLVDSSSIVVNAMSGVSGAGRSKHNLTYHFPELNESATGYGLAGAHRHTPEIEQTLTEAAGGKTVTLSFTPHLIPITRGILSTTVAKLTSDIDAAALVDRFRSYYRTAPFVVVLDAGQVPATKHTQGTNFVHIGLAVDKRLGRVTVVTAEDNLVKGAAGQAIQNMNLISGFDEKAGLMMAAIWP
ncbi:MAG TPA: N-acetyl-gamma-glutamyl-phosphate reductase [Capsulimonadaceae bacterium]|jgi:N-acetyl-gamma-glutamyl-phosphate reductase